MPDRRRHRLADLTGEAIARPILAIHETAGRALDALLGPRCRYGCGQRIYPRDIAFHELYDHAGDRLPNKPTTREA